MTATSPLVALVLAPPAAMPVADSSADKRVRFIGRDEDSIGGGEGEPEREVICWAPVVGERCGIRSRSAVFRGREIERGPMVVIWGRWGG